jgi:hypothetical protein
MGMIELGIPKKIVLELKNLAGATQFVETGTLAGETSRWASDHFETVYTIELSKMLYDHYSDGLKSLRNVKPYQGDSRDVLPSILSEIGDQKIVFWLDGHWSAGETAGEEEECPLIGELDLIRERDGDIILIDDARFFLCAPYQPLNPAKWPGISEIVKMLDASEHRRYIQIVDDVIFAVPHDELVMTRLSEYAANRSAEFWQDYAVLHHNASRPSWQNRFKAVIKDLKQSLSY